MASKAQPPRAGWIPIFGLIVLSFLTATAYAQWRMLEIDGAALGIAENTAPGIERLSSSRGEILQIRGMARAYVETGKGRASFDPSPYEAARRRLGEHIDAYLEMPLSPGEHDPWTRIVRTRAVLDEDLTRFEAEASRGSSDVALARAKDVLAAADELSTAITGSVQIDAAHSLDLALEIRRVRTRTTVLAFVLDAVCAIITVIAAVVLHRTLRSHAALAEQHRRLHEERASRWSSSPAASRTTS